MKLKGLVWFFTIVLIVISLWQLSYTFAIRSHESKVLAQAEKLLKKSNPALKGEDFNAAAIVKQKRILDSNNTVLYEQAMQTSKMVYAVRKDSLGKGFYRGDKLVNEPMDFSKKNNIGLAELTSILQSIIFPESLSAKQRFNITEEDRQFLLKYMSQLPTESTFPPYSDEPTTYWPSYCKFLYFGSEKGAIPKNIRVFNKVGDAYGHLIDVAYIVDFDKNIEFFLSASIYCNSDEILNDDKYDYDSIGFPFMKNLGKIIYEEEVNRKRKIVPDLSGLKFVYDKN